MRQENTERIALDLDVTVTHLKTASRLQLAAALQVPLPGESIKSGRAGEGTVSVQRH